MNTIQAFVETLKVSRTLGHTRSGRVLSSQNVRISKV